MDIMDIAIAKALSGGGGGGSAENFYVTFTVDYDTSTATSDKTYAEIWSAFEGGKNVVGIIKWSDAQEGNTEFILLNLTEINHYSDPQFAGSASFTGFQNAYTSYTISVSEGGIIMYSYHEYE